MNKLVKWFVLSAALSVSQGSLASTTYSDTPAFNLDASPTSSKHATGIWWNSTTRVAFKQQDLSKIYVANNGSANVTVIDGASNATTTVPAGSRPVSVAVNPDTNKIYVANNGSANVTVIDGASNATTTVRAGTEPNDVKVNRVTNKIYVANYRSGSVTVIDGATNATTTVAVGAGPYGCAVNSVTNKIYVANENSNSVTVIDGATNATTTIAAGAGPRTVAVNPVTDRIYVANLYSANVTVIDGATNATTTVATGTQPIAVAVNPVTNKIYVANQGSGSVTVIDGVTNATGTVAVGTAPRRVRVNTDTNRVYVANQGSNNVTVIDGATNATTTVAVGAGPRSLAVNPVSNKIYVANASSNTVTVIDGATNATTTIAAGTNPWAVDVSPFTSPESNHTALWWNPTESGWGINLNHQGDIVFGTLFTYDSAGAPLWLVMSSGNLVSGTTYSGVLYRTTGPAFNANPFTPIGAGNLTQVGTMTVTFTGADTATLSYTVNGVAVSKSIQKQVYGTRAASCSPTTGSRAALTNYQDLWWNAAESGWGVNVTHQDNTLFATLFTYDATGRDLWLVMSGGTRQADGSYLGTLYRTRGPAFNANPFTPIGLADLTNVGTMRFRFSDGISGTLSYTYNGVPVTKQITRQVFSSPVPSCN